MSDQLSSTLGTDRSKILPGTESPAESQAMEELSCRVETSFEALEPFRHTWDEAVVRLGGSIYMSYDWSRIWWEFYGAGKELRIFVFSAGDVVVGILPLYISTLGAWPFKLKVARLVGANIPPKVFNPPVDVQHAESVLKVAITHMLTCESCQVISLGPISELYGQHIIQAARKYSVSTCEIALKPCGVHSLFALPGSYDEYFQSLTKKERKNNRNRYDLSLLRQDHAAFEEFVSDPERVAMEYETFVDLHTREWQQKGGTGHFFSWPSGKEFNRVVVCRQASLGRTEFLKIVAEEKTVASIYTYYIGGICHAELMGRQLGQEWDKYNLGRAILVRAVARAIQRGCRFLDAGLGHYDYKDRLNAQEHAVFQIRCERTGPRARMVIFIFKCIRIFLLALYHKFWYRRIRKLLPLRWRKPHAAMWLRFDY
jgi:hypothetical protein